MAKILFFQFDGTDNKPADAMQDKNYISASKASSITNVLKFHLLPGGNLGKTANTLLPEGSRTLVAPGIRRDTTQCSMHARVGVPP